MQEFMLFIKTEGDHLENLSPEEQQVHVQNIGNYIGDLNAIRKTKRRAALRNGRSLVFMEQKAP